MLINSLSNKKQRKFLLIVLIFLLLSIYLIVVRFEFENIMNAFVEHYSIEKAFKNEKVNSVYYLSSKHNIDLYKLSPELRKNGWVYYSIINSTYPKKLSASSKNFFKTNLEISHNKNCILLDTKGTIELYEC